MRLEIRPAGGWSALNESYIRRALATASIGDIKRQVEQGAQLFEVLDEAGDCVAAFVLRVDHLECRSVGVVVAAGGGLAGADLTATLMPHIERMFYGCDAIAIHTERPGLLRKLARQGYRTAEIILEKEVRNHG